MAIINNLPTRGGVKMDLLWSNPNPKSAMSSSLTVNFNFNDYDVVLIQTSPHANYDEDAWIYIQVKSNDRWLGIHVAHDTFASYRNITITSTGITFGTTAGYSYHNGGNATGSSFCIPERIYGINGKIKTS